MPSNSLGIFISMRSVFRSPFSLLLQRILIIFRF